MNTFDYVVRITSDQKLVVHINCHRCVLLAHSGQMRTLINNENYWDMDIRVRPGYVAAAAELIQYMYLKDSSLITEKNKVLELCALFEMPLDHFLIRTDALERLNKYPVVHLTLEEDASSCLITSDFIQRLKVDYARIRKASPSEPIALAPKVAPVPSIATQNQTTQTEGAAATKGAVAIKDISSQELLADPPRAPAAVLSPADEESSDEPAPVKRRSRPPKRSAGSMNQLKLRAPIKRKRYSLRKRK